MGNAPIYKPYEGFVVLLQRNLRQLFIRTQIAIPTWCKHRYLQERRDMKNLWNIKGSHLWWWSTIRIATKSMGDVLLEVVITTTIIWQTDLCLRPYRSGRDYCSEFNIVCAHYLSLTTSPHAKIIVFWYFTIKRQILTVPIPSIKLLVS